MKYPYPKMTNTLKFTRVSEDKVDLHDYATDVEVTIPLWEAWLLHQLDGYTDPYSFGDIFSEEEVDELLAFYDEYDILRRPHATLFEHGMSVKSTVFEP